MEKVIKTIKNNKMAVAIMVLSIFIISSLLYNIVRSTYAGSNYTIVFNRAEDTEVMKTCTTDANGKLTSDCLNEIAKVCSYWSLDKCTHSGCNNNNDYQSDPKSISDLGNMTFSANTNYYCKGGSSQPGYHKACYVCKTDSSIVKWGFNWAADDKCPAGYNQNSIQTEEECVVNACYECKTDSTIMEWRDNATGDNKCSGGYNKTEKTEAECQYVAPKPTYACYECKSDSTIMEWRDNATGDNKCSSGYNKTEKTEAECQYVAPKPTYACYECKADKSILKWKESALGDSACPGGYNKTVKTQSQCKVEVPTNPPTGGTVIIFAWIVAGVAIGYSLWYLKKSV